MSVSTIEATKELRSFIRKVRQWNASGRGVHPMALEGYRNLCGEQAVAVKELELLRSREKELQIILQRAELLSAARSQLLQSLENIATNGHGAQFSMPTAFASLLDSEDAEARLEQEKLDRQREENAAFDAKLDMV